jgi:hypothetical protein
MRVSECVCMHARAMISSVNRLRFALTPGGKQSSGTGISRSGQFRVARPRWRLCGRADETSLFLVCEICEVGEVAQGLASMELIGVK